MQMDMTKPCSQCPFLTSCRRGWLGRTRAKEIADALFSDKSFSCHKTVDYSEDEDGDTMPPPAPEEQHCAGAAIFLEKQGRANQWMRWMERLGFYDRHKMDMAAPVFGTYAAFVKHHSPQRDKAARK